jgi:HK97 family phage prohead protease
MPVPKPHKGESQDDFTDRCMSALADSDPDRPNEQRVAMCFSAWREEHGGEPPKLPNPSDDESEDDFIDRCVSALQDNYDLDDEAAENICQTRWDESGNGNGDRSASRVIHKTHTADVEGMEFVLSDETPDRIGDIIMSDGWDLRSFARNPIALWSHRADFPIGRWLNLRVEDKSLRGRLALAPEGTSDRIDEIRRLVEAGILKAVSVGFRELDAERLEPKNPWGGMKFKKQELIECSLVSVPANPNALAVTKSLKISPQTVDLIFRQARHRSQAARNVGLVGKHAEPAIRQHERSSPMAGLAQRIIGLQEGLVASRAALAAHLETMDDNNVSEADIEKMGTLNADIAQKEKTHAALVESEKRLGESLGNGSASPSRALVPVVTQRASVVQTAPSIKIGANINPKKSSELDPLDYICRCGAILIAQKTFGGAATVDQVRDRLYGDDEPTRLVSDILLKAASAPAMTSVAGWAQELVHIIYTDLMPLLLPHAILTRLAAKGLALSFGRAGKIVIPTRSRTPALSGSFVGEGQAIPVRQGAFTSQTLTPKKVAVITTWTKEMDEYSIPAIEGILREAIQLDTGIAVDSVLIDANPATAIRPAGLLNGVTVTTPTAGGGLTSILGDIKALVGALTANTFGNVREPVWLLNPQERLRAALVITANGVFPFRDEIAGGTLNGIPFIESATVPAGTVVLIDAADFVTVGADGPRLDMSDQATLHFEDTAPQDLAQVGSPPVVAAPQKSLFQTDSLALRLQMWMNWIQRRVGTIAYSSPVTWN